MNKDLALRLRVVTSRHLLLTAAVLEILRLNEGPARSEFAGALDVVAFPAGVSADAAVEPVPAGATDEVVDALVAIGTSLSPSPSRWSLTGGR